nr:Fic family protein [Rhizobium leguminosarum]
MRKDALDNIGFEQLRINDRDGYIAQIDERYVADALNSLSIAGHEVSEDLIQRVQDGAWKPDEDAQDYETKNALAAKGYRLAFEEVRDDIKKILDGAPTGKLLEERHQDWFRAMFSPSVTAGIIKAHQLAGYRSHNVYLRGSSHVPLPPHAIADAMDALFESIEEEPDPRAKAVVAPFLFTYIHPFPDGNGRTARFIMNALLAECGVPWTGRAPGRVHGRPGTGEPTRKHRTADDVRIRARQCAPSGERGEDCAKSVVGRLHGFVANFFKGRRSGHRWTQLCSECGELLKCRLATG